MEITDFLLARIAKDERVAKRATQGRWITTPFDGIDSTDRSHNPSGYVAQTSYDDQSDTVGNSEADADHIARWSASRVLAECAAKRAILDEPTVSDRVLRLMARPYEGKPGWDPAWQELPEAVKL